MEGLTLKTSPEQLFFLISHHNAIKVQFMSEQGKKRKRKGVKKLCMYIWTDMDKLTNVSVSSLRKETPGEMRARPFHIFKGMS